MAAHPSLFVVSKKTVSTSKKYERTQKIVTVSIPTPIAQIELLSAAPNDPKKTTTDPMIDRYRNLMIQFNVDRPMRQKNLTVTSVPSSPSYTGSQLNLPILDSNEKK
mmetsp:Transcript_36767/g.89023  ORF Transcript_36767/g.89023 Transcript_36767/m.89023 type:complete len:107 (+) Transcript_36767:2236-2556(+)